VTVADTLDIVTEDGRGEPFVIAVDAGGTHTRVACYGLDGTRKGAASGRGGSPFHNTDASENVSETIARAILDGELDARDAVGLVAGLANISRSGSNQGDGNNDWAQSFFVVPSLGCEPVVVNDAVVAHRGALLGRHGVMVVAGTGSMILAITEDGTEVESGQFEHYAGAARHLVFEAMQQILIGEAGPEDAELVLSVLDYWNVADIGALRSAVLRLAETDRLEVRRRYGRLAPTITSAAETSPLADRALRDLTEKTARGIRLLAPLVAADRVPVAVSGALATTPAFTSRLSDALGELRGPRAALVPPALDPLGGAALIALQGAGVEITDDLIDRLRLRLHLLRR
jgi:glucosamine kinase